MQPSLRISTVSFSSLSFSQEFYAKLRFNVDYQITVTAHIPPMNRVLSNFAMAQPCLLQWMSKSKTKIFLVHMIGRSLKCST